MTADLIDISLIKIEKNIPFNRWNKKPGGNVVLMEQILKLMEHPSPMEIGDSFFIPSNESVEERRRMTNLRTIIQKCFALKKWKCGSATQWDKEDKIFGVRFWRISFSAPK